MFTGIIETKGHITDIVRDGSNVHITVQSPLSSQFHIDQSVSHNGVCLTVVSLTDDTHTVTAIQETLDRSNIGELQVGDFVNLERAMVAGARLDGHMVQGHVDGTGKCLSITDLDGSWEFRFSYQSSPLHLLVDKGSVCVNGVSLTVVNPTDTEFSVCIIPYTFEHTTFGHLRPGHTINLEFDIIGKYIGQYMQHYASKTA